MSNRTVQAAAEGVSNQLQNSARPNNNRTMTSDTPMSGKAQHTSQAYDSTAVARAALGLEDAVQSVASFSRLTAELLDWKLDLEHAEKVGEDFVRITLSRTELNDLAFMANETQYRMRRLTDAYYAAMHAGRA